jgi:hypothetical protein
MVLCARLHAQGCCAQQTLSLLQLLLPSCLRPCLGAQDCYRQASYMARLLQQQQLQQQQQGPLPVPARQMQAGG